jgi:hypothetical protein
MTDSTISKGIRILINHGPSELLQRIRATGERKFGTLEYWISRLQGARRIRIGNYSVDIGISSFHGDYGEVRFFEENEVDEMIDILSEINSDDVFLDIGANIGIHSLFAEKAASKVYAIEPYPTNSSHFLFNIKKKIIQILNSTSAPLLIRRNILDWLENEVD